MSKPQTQYNSREPNISNQNWQNTKYKHLRLTERLDEDSEVQITPKEKAMVQFNTTHIMQFTCIFDTCTALSTILPIRKACKSQQ